MYCMAAQRHLSMRLLVGKRRRVVVADDAVVVVVVVAVRVAW